MDQRTSERDAGATTEFEIDVVKLLLETMSNVDKQEREDAGTESLLAALVSGDSAAGSAIAPGMRASGSLSGSISARGTSVWVSDDTGDGAAGAPDDEREIDSVWREVRQDRASRLRWKNRKKEEAERESVELPPVTGALRACLRNALVNAREEGAVSVRVRHVAYALVELPDTRAREAMVVEKVDISAASAALDALRGSDTAPEPGSVLMLRKSGTFGKSGNPLTRKFSAWVFGGGAGFGSSVVSAVRAEALRGAVRRGAPEQEPVDVLLGILALDRSLAVAGRELPEKLTGANQGRNCCAGTAHGWTLSPGCCSLPPGPRRGSSRWATEPPTATDGFCTSRSTPLPPRARPRSVPPICWQPCWTRPGRTRSPRRRSSVYWPRAGWTSPRCARSRNSGSREERHELPEAATVRRRV